MGHRGVIVRSLGVVRQVTSRRLRGSQSISREPPIMRDLRILKELPPRSGHDGLSTLEREAILVGMYWELTQSESAPTGGCREVDFYPVTRKSARL